MNLLLFYTSHRQTWEITESAKHLKAGNLFAACPLILHCNCPAVFKEVARAAEHFFPRPSTTLICTEKNTGYSYGHLEALVDCFHLLECYDCVVHAHPDVFFIDTAKIETSIRDFYQNPETPDLLVSPMRAWNKPSDTGFCTDFFAFRPTPRFKEALAAFPREPYKSMAHPERFLQRRCEELGLSWQILPRSQWMGKGPRFIENVGLWHEHSRRRYRAFTILQGVERALRAPGLLTSRFHFHSGYPTSASALS